MSANKNTAPGTTPRSHLPADRNSKYDFVLQSPYLKLWAAGYENKYQDKKSSQGIHLRWLLDGHLGENHLPKGDYASTTDYFNRPDDFVNIWRIPYNSKKPPGLFFNPYDTPPDRVNQALWVYNNGLGTVYLQFEDTGKYNSVLNAVPDPINNYRAFLTAYGNAVLQVVLPDKLSFAVNINLSQNAVLKAETFSVQNKSYAEDLPVISARITVANGLPYTSSAGSVLTGRIVAENIRSLKFRLDAGSLNYILFETYESFLANSAESKIITPIDKFALTKDTQIAYTRLEDNTRFTIDDSWDKFNDDAFVNAENYRDRWRVSRGLEEGVDTYISLSDTDPSALTTYNEETNAQDQTTMDVSLLKFLNIAAMDFHVARMLGLGYIDTFDEAAKGNEFIYMAEYATNKDPENYEVEKLSYHVYMTLPTSFKEERLPLKLKFDPVSYGLTTETGTNNPLPLTDANGYTLYEQSRYIRLKVRPERNYALSASFFQPSVEFQSSDFTMPVFTGIENKKEPEADWRKPEISHDLFYKDTKNINETQTIFINKNSPGPTYIHEVTEEGVDMYAAYPVNIFSRASGLSNIVKTDKTIFKKANTLKAPANVSVTLIQKENPLLLTAQAEQQWLQNIDPGGTEILCRLVFDYYHIHDINYRYGNKVQVFHKKQFPRNIIGSLQPGIDNDPNVPVCVLNTAGYTYLSNGQQFTPQISAADIYKFIGGRLTYNRVIYIIDNITLTNPDGTNPNIIIRKNETREAVFVNGTYQLKRVFQAPVFDANEAFLIVENLSPAANWKEATDNKLAFEIDLGQSSFAEHNESYIDTEGNTRNEKVKGIWDNATIVADANAAGDYTITLNNALLQNHPQYISPDNAAGTPTVNWYRGFIRVHKAGDATDQKERKLLRVKEITGINSGNPLVLTVTDIDYSATTPAENIKTGNGISVNFHPGYRVYLRKDTAAEFDGTHILPGNNEGTKNTLIGLRTLDTSMTDDAGDVYSSAMSTPAILAARELRPPKKPRKPIGPMFATPPDFYNKATYSFEVEFEHKPWGLVFFRADTNKILSCLYEPATIAAIKSSLPAVKDDANLEERWNDLLSFDYSDNGGDFLSFETTPGGTQYKFPKPDRSDVFTQPYGLPQDVAAIMKDMICSNLLPLTQQPLIFDFIKGGTYVPLPKKQNVTDRNGKVLSPSDPDFDQAPMAKKINDTKVRFTDFTLDGNMDSETAYLYLVRELSNSMQMGEPSAFFGPVQLLNTKAPEKLNIKKVAVHMASVENNYKTAVDFDVNAIAAGQEISRIRILRTAEAADSLSPAAMEMVKDIPLQPADLSGGIFTVTDDFSTGTEIPFGVPLYYKLIGVRVVNYIDITGAAKAREVYSEPTRTLLANVIDTINPEPANISISNPLVTGDYITQLNLSWEKKCYSGKYIVSILTDSGAWQKIYEVRSNDQAQLKYTYSCHLKINDDTGNPVYHKFKVDVENTAGLINKTTRIVAYKYN